MEQEFETRGKKEYCLIQLKCNTYFGADDPVLLYRNWQLFVQGTDAMMVVLSDKRVRQRSKECHNS